MLTMIEDERSVTKSDFLCLVGEKVSNPHADGREKALVKQLGDQDIWEDSVEGRAIIVKQHPHICVPLL